jgi:hypothetical protein
MSDLAKQWKEKIAERAAERAAQVVSVPVCFSGFSGQAHRLDLMGYARAGKMPQFLSAAMFAALDGKTIEIKKSEVTHEQMMGAMRFQRIAFCEMFDAPRFSTEDMRAGRPLADDELDYTDFVQAFPEVVREAAQWQMGGCPNMPIPTESGEVSLEDLHNFRDGGQGIATPESGARGGVFWFQTTPVAKNLGNIG